MTTPTQSVSVRRIVYVSGSPSSIVPYLYDSQYDSSLDDVLDEVLMYDPSYNIQGYRWDGTRQVSTGGGDSSAPTHHLSFDGIGDKIVVPKSSSINNLPLGDFTIEFVGGDFTLGNNETIGIFYKINSDYENWMLYFWRTTGVANLSILVTYDNWDSWVNPCIELPDISGVHHYEIDWTQSTKSFKMFVDGVEYLQIDPLPQGGSPTTYDDDSLIDLTIGLPTQSGYQNLAGNINWIRISDSVRHTSNFTPPSLTLCPAADANTVLRLALDEGTGTDAGDTSGNNNNGTITGATWEVDA